MATDAGRRVTTLVSVTNNTGYTIKVKQQQTDKVTSIDNTVTTKVNYDVPWYSQHNTKDWSDRYIEFYFPWQNGNDPPDTETVSASVWQHGRGTDILWQEGTGQPPTPSTGYAFPNIQQGAQFNITVNTVPSNSTNDPPTISLTAAPN